MEWETALSHFSNNYENIIEYYDMLCEVSDDNLNFYYMWMKARAYRFYFREINISDGESIGLYTKDGITTVYSLYKPYYENVINKFPDRAEALYELAKNAVNPQESYELYKKCIKILQPSKDKIDKWTNLEIYKWRALNNYIIECYHLGKYGEIPEVYFDVVYKMKEIFDSGEKQYKEQITNLIYYANFSSLEHLDISCHKDCSYLKFRHDIYYQHGFRGKYDEKHIPNIIHFIWIKGDREFSIIQYLTICAVYEVQKPDKIYIYNDVEPDIGTLVPTSGTNIWWNLVKQIDNVEMVNVTPPRYINGRMIPWAQHVADLMRICILYERGGIYIDADLLLLKSVNDLIVEDKVTLSREIGMNHKIWNGFIAAPPKCNFFKRWIREYELKYGDPEIGCWWAGASVETPMILYKIDSSEVNLIDSQYLLPFGIYENKLYESMTTSNNCINNCTNKCNVEVVKFYEDIVKNSYGLHLWQTESQKRGVLPKNEHYFTENKFTPFTKFFSKYCKNMIV